MKRTWTRAGFAFALAAGSIVLGFASPAGAAVNSCKNLAGTATFSPGLTTTAHNQKITAKGTLTGCTPATQTGGSGTLTSTITSANGSCQSLAKGGVTSKGTSKVVWKNKKTSTIAITLKTGTGTNYTVATVTGKVTAGLFQGHAISGQLKFTPKSGQNCTTVPIKSVTFKGTKPFTMK
jgi:hypothetical protein